MAPPQKKKFSRILGHFPKKRVRVKNNPISTHRFVKNRQKPSFWPKIFPFSRDGMANLPFWVRSGDLERFWPKTTDMAVFYIKMGRNMVVIESWSFFWKMGQN